jgi:hypothetical protein
MLYKQANEQVNEIKHENLPQINIIKNVDCYHLGAEMIATVMAIPLLMIHHGIALFAYLLRPVFF